MAVGILASHNTGMLLALAVLMKQKGQLVNWYPSRQS